jgi:hypothetical protein
VKPGAFGSVVVVMADLLCASRPEFWSGSEHVPTCGRVMSIHPHPGAEPHRPHVPLASLSG